MIKKVFNTKQRQLTLAELSKLTSHPTAEELHLILRSKLPNISLGTVYRNLNRLADENIIQRIIGRDQTRFEANTQSHYHLRCKACGRVYDLNLEEIDAIKKALSEIKFHQATDYNLEFHGICKKCKEQ